MSVSENRGQFAKGTSGNRRGRPKKKPTGFSTLAEADALIINSMNRKIGAERMPLFEARFISLALGKESNPLACRSALRLTLEALARSDERRRQQEIEAERLQAREDARRRARGDAIDWNDHE